MKKSIRDLNQAEQSERDVIEVHCGQSDAETAFLSTIPVLITPGTPAAATLMEGPAESDTSL